MAEVWGFDVNVSGVKGSARSKKTSMYDALSDRVWRQKCLCPTFVCGHKNCASIASSWLHPTAHWSCFKNRVSITFPCCLDEMNRKYWGKVRNFQSLLKGNQGYSTHENRQEETTQELLWGELGIGYTHCRSKVSQHILPACILNAMHFILGLNN